MIILLIHLLRKNEPYDLNIFVPNLSGIEQTFIDDLNGKNISINDIMKQNIRELFHNLDLINIGNLFKKELYTSFQKIYYIFQNNNHMSRIKKIIYRIFG